MVIVVKQEQLKGNSECIQSSMDSVCIASVLEEAPGRYVLPGNLGYYEPMKPEITAPLVHSVCTVSTPYH